jgi:hypothetical protein
MNLLGQKLCKACLLQDDKNGGLLKLGIIGRIKVPDPSLQELFGRQARSWSVCTGF